MAALAEQITSSALALPGQARAVLAQVLLRSLDEPAEDDGVAEAWEREIARRLERVRNGEAAGRPAGEVFREIEARYSR